MSTEAAGSEAIPEAPVATPGTPTVDGRSGRRPRALSADYWITMLWLLTGAQVVLVATHVEVGRDPRGYEFALGNAFLLSGLFAHWRIGRARGQFDLPWIGFLFPLAFVLFHFGTFGLEHRWYARELVGFAWQVSVLGLLAWLSGFDAARGAARIRLRPMFVVSGRPIGPFDRRMVLNAAKGAIVLALGLQAALLLKYGVVEFFTRVYGKEALTPSADNWLAYLYTLGGVIMSPAIVTLAAASVACTGKLFPSRRWLLVVLLYLASMMAEGDRGSLALAVLPLLIIQHYWVRRVRWRSGMLLILAGLTMFGMLKLYRGSKNVADAVAETFQASTYEMLFHEMGNTLDVVVRSMAVVPVREDYFGGKTYVWAVARALPNMSLQPREWGFVSSKWIVEETAPDIAARFGGFGFSIVAEAYINFGALGVGGFLFLLGVVTGRLERLLAAPRVELWTLVLVCLFELSLVTHVRNTGVIFVRGFVWMACIVLLIRASGRMLSLPGRLARGRVPRITAPAAAVEPA